MLFIFRSEHSNMEKTYMIPARYMEQNALEDYLGKLFGYGKVEVLVGA